jgi:methylase of polypeptide subunit release factors
MWLSKLEAKPTASLQSTGRLVSLEFKAKKTELIPEVCTEITVTRSRIS